MTSTLKGAKLTPPLKWHGASITERLQGSSGSAAHNSGVVTPASPRASISQATCSSTVRVHCWV
jgi:hypothetical protein